MATAQVNLGSSTRTRRFRTGQKKCIRRVLKYLDSMLLKTRSGLNPRSRHIYDIRCIYSSPFPPSNLGLVSTQRFTKALLIAKHCPVLKKTSSSILFVHFPHEYYTKTMKFSLYIKPYLLLCVLNLVKASRVVENVH